jgi:hypothetical protein
MVFFPAPIGTLKLLAMWPFLLVWVPRLGHQAGGLIKGMLKKMDRH